MERIEELEWHELPGFEFDETNSVITVKVEILSEQEPLWVNHLTRQDGERLALWLSRVPGVPLTMSHDLRLTARTDEPDVIWVHVSGRNFQFPRVLIHSEILNTLEYLLDAIPNWIVPRPRW